MKYFIHAKEARALSRVFTKVLKDIFPVLFLLIDYVIEIEEKISSSVAHNSGDIRSWPLNKLLEKIMPDYHSIFDHNNHVQIAAENVLKEFMETWKFHHPISNTHLQYANQKAFVESVYYYHGGAPLYTLFIYEANGSKKSIPAMWHECLINEADPSWKKIPANEVLTVNSEIRNGILVVVVKNISTNFEYLVSHKIQNELAAKDMQIVFNRRDLQMVASKYGFDLEPKF